MGIEAYGDIVRCDTCGRVIMDITRAHVRIFQSYEVMYAEIRRLKWYIDAEEVCCSTCFAKKEVPK